MYKSQVEGRKGMNEQNAVMQQHNVKGVYCEKSIEKRRKKDKSSAAHYEQQRQSHRCLYSVSKILMMNP